MNRRSNGLRLATFTTALTAVCAVSTGHVVVAQDAGMEELTTAVSDLATVASTPSDLVITEILPNTTGHDES